MLGLGVTALLASFMSGMAGNITAFNTVVTYDIYQAYIKKNMADRHHLTVGRTTTILGIVFACASSYIVPNFNNLMDYMQLIGILFISPFFIAFLAGMLWKRPSATAGFLSMLGGLASAAGVRALQAPCNIICFADGRKSCHGGLGADRRHAGYPCGNVSYKAAGP
jgi:SSS family solute:Na+ symporter